MITGILFGFLKLILLLFLLPCDKQLCSHRRFDLKMLAISLRRNVTEFSRLQSENLFSLMASCIPLQIYFSLFYLNSSNRFFLAFHLIKTFF